MTSAVDEPGHSTRAVLRGAAGAWRRDPGLAVTAIACLVVQQLFTTGLAVSLKVIVDDVTQHRPSSRLAALIVALVVGFVLTVMATVIGERASAIGAARVVKRIRRTMYGHLLRLSPAYYLATEPGRILKRFQSDVVSLERGYVQGFLDTLVLVIDVAVTVPVMWWLDWRLTLITVAMLPIVVLSANRLLPRWVRVEDEASAADLDVVNGIQETIRAQQVIRAFGLENVMSRRFEDRLTTLQRTSVASGSMGATVGKGASLGVLLVQVAVVIVGAELALHDVMPVSSLVAFMILLGVLAKNVYDYCRTDLLLLAGAWRGARAVEAHLAAPTIVGDTAAASELAGVHDGIRFESVTFGYHAGDRPAVGDASFTIPAGTRVAIVGQNGSGKSTMLSLLMRFHDPDSGRVTIDGRDLRTITQDSLRARFGIVLQESFVFNDTIRENIRVGRPDASDDDVADAAHRAHLDDLIATLPLGFDTVVGEGGGSLSGGHRQRLAIARALLHDPTVLLLDEVTSALDPATEAAVNETLADVARGRTVVAVTHRLAALSEVDRIVVLDRGHVAGMGTHEELVLSCRAYLDMWQKQSGFVISGDGKHARLTPTRLRQVNLFADLDDATLTRLSEELTSEYFPADQQVITYGDVGDRFYLVARGDLEVLAPRPDGTYGVLNLISDGDHFGELALLHDQPRSATIRTVSPSLLLSMSQKQFLELVQETPELARLLDERVTSTYVHARPWFDDGHGDNSDRDR